MGDDFWELQEDRFHDYVKPKRQEMNQSAIALIAMEARAVGVEYDSSGGIYTFAWFLNVEPVLDMRVIVPSNGRTDRFTSGTIKSLDVDFDVDSDYKYKFVAGIFKPEAFDAQTATLGLVMKAIKKVKNKKARADILDALSLDPEELRKIRNDSSS